MARESESVGLVFGPGRKTRRSEYVLVSFVMLGCSMVAVPFGLMTLVLVSELGFPGAMIIALCAGAVVALGCLWVGWHTIRRRLQFTIEITPTEIHFGRGRLRESFPSEDVEIIRMSEAAALAGDPTTWLEVRVRGRLQRFYLDGCEEACADTLRRHCPNAVYIDAGGKERMPMATERPLYVLNNLVRYRLRGGWGMVVCGVLLLAWSVPLVVLMVAGILNGTQPWSKLWEARLLLLFLAGGLALLVFGQMQVCKGRRLAAEARRLKDRGIKDADRPEDAEVIA